MKFCTQYRRDEVALRTTCIKNFKIKIIKIRTVCQYEGYFPLRTEQNLRLGNMQPAGWT